MKNKYKKENLEKTISKCKSYSDIARILGMARTGNNHSTFKKYIELHNIDISHFENNYDAMVRFNKSNRTPTKEMLTENSTCSRSGVKKRLIDEKLIPYECGCGIKNLWNNKELVLQLDHINGVNNDNRIENLRFLCPNCHSQTKTFCGKSIKNTCINCDIVINKKSKRCIACQNKRKDLFLIKKKKFNFKMKNLGLTENILIKLIENNNYTQVGKIYKVSDNTIRKWLSNFSKFK